MVDDDENGWKQRSNSRRQLDDTTDFFGSTLLRSLDSKDCDQRLESNIRNDDDEMNERNIEDNRLKWRLRRKTDKSLKSISLEQVAWHDTPDDCWIVIYDYVYDCTNFLDSHQGGRDVLMEYAGRDATIPFVGTGHSKAATKILDKYLIGELPPEERIFRKLDGLKVTGL